MAYGAVVSLMQILQQIMDPDLHVLYQKQQIQSLQEKVSFLLDFLERYSVYTDQVVKDLEIKIRDATYIAEDIIESYVSTFILNRTNWIRRSLIISCDGENNSTGEFQTFCGDLDRIIEETHSIQQEVMDVKHRLDLKYVQQRKTLPVDRSTLTFTDAAPPLVGLVEHKMKVKEWLVSSSSEREVISIVGMGGIGKTTFAQNLFDDSLLVQLFDIRAWVTVSQECQMHAILAGLLDSISKLNPDMGKASCKDLSECLYKSLKGRRYLIMMDDIWETKVWDEINSFLPDDHNGSRIVLTSRLAGVGGHAASTGYLHDMSLLNSSESWNLFHEKAFRGECCPPCLEGIGQEIVRNCKGLPLSIVVVAGLLSMDKTVSYWETIANALGSILVKEGGQCSSIFSLSYNHLPAQLKPCFLYLAIFPEDHVIIRSRLIKLWIAEGFIKPEESKSLEDIAEECLEDLLNRSLIMVREFSKLGCVGRAERYVMHDLLRDFCVRESEKEKFLCVRNRHTPSYPEGIRCERRISIHPCTPSQSMEYNLEPPLLTRSILLSYRPSHIITSEIRFGLLRVLDMRSGYSFLKFPMEVVRLVHLRYLSLDCDELDNVPASISSIWGLQTLSIFVFDFSDASDDLCNLPLEVWTMPHLRHICIKLKCCHLPDPPINSGVEGVILANLQTLSEMGNFRFTDEIVKRIPKLKKLRVCYGWEMEDWSQCHLDNMVCLNELESLRIDSHSKLAFPPNVRFPATLKKLNLSLSFPGWEDLTMVGSLPNLEVLKLRRGTCRGAVWEPKEGEFCQLKFLELEFLDLVEWRADDSHFPQLKCLQILNCRRLKAIPIEIGNIPTLEMIRLRGPLPSAKDSAKLILDEQKSLGNDALQVLY